MSIRAENRYANFKLNENFYFTVFFIKIAPLTKDSIVKSTTFFKTY